MALDATWAQFYAEASGQDVIDPATVVAIARSETGDAAAAAGHFTLGIDTRGAGGSGGSSLTIGNPTHTFYAYSSGVQAADGLAGFLQANPRYGADIASLFHDPGALLARMVGAGYSGCPGPECDPVWDQKILSIRDRVVSAFGGSPVAAALSDAGAAVEQVAAGAPPWLLIAVGAAVLILLRGGR